MNGAKQCVGKQLSKIALMLQSAIGLPHMNTKSRYLVCMLPPLFLIVVRVYVGHGRLWRPHSHSIFTYVSLLTMAHRDV